MKAALRSFVVVGFVSLFVVVVAVADDPKTCSPNFQIEPGTIADGYLPVKISYNSGCIGGDLSYGLHDGHEIIWSFGKRTCCPQLPNPWVTDPRAPVACLDGGVNYLVSTTLKWDNHTCPRDCRNVTTYFPLSPLPTPWVTPYIGAPASDGSQAFTIDYDLRFASSTSAITAKLIPSAGGAIQSLGSWSPGNTQGMIGPVGVPERGTVIIKWGVCGNTSERALEFNDIDCDDCSQNACPSCVGDPVRTSNGNARFSDVDPLPGADVLPLVRTYDSMSTGVGYFGRRWTSFLDSAVQAFADGGDTAAFVRVIDESGDAYVFRRSSASASYVQISPTPGGSPRQLTAGSGWTLADEERRVTRTYDTAGRITRYANALGRGITITYGGSPSRPTRIADDPDWGRPAWLPVYNSNGRIERITPVQISLLRSAALA